MQIYWSFNDSATEATAVHLLKAPPVPEQKQKCFELNGFLSHDNQTNKSTNAKWPNAVSLRVRDEWKQPKRRNKDEGQFVKETFFLHHFDKKGKWARYLKKKKTGNEFKGTHTQFQGFWNTCLITSVAAWSSGCCLHLLGLGMSAAD